MATYETVYFSNPGQERLRLWTKEKKPEIELKFKEMKRDINAGLGQRVRDILRQTPYDHHAIMNACRAAEEEENELARLLSEGVEAEATRIKTVFMHAALNHPGEPDPTEEVRERIKSDPQAESAYCSPILVETLLWEGQGDLPNTHRKRLELDFPDRVEALLEFHCIAFHADVNILKELYDEDTNGKKENRKEVLANHRAKMETLMASYAEEMSASWAKEKERLRMTAAAQSPPAHPPARWEKNDWMTSQPPPPNNAAVAGGHRHAHMMNPPAVVGAVAEPRPKTAQSMPLRGILKNASAGASVGGVPSRGAASSNHTVAVESLTFDEDDNADFPGPFFLGQMIVEGDMNTNRRYLEPNIAMKSPSYQQHASTSRSYELYRPRSANDAMRGIPRTANGNNVAQMTQRFEAMENGKGKGKQTL